MHGSTTLIADLGKPAIREALSGKTAEKRANAVQRIGRHLRAAELSESDRAFADKLLERICADVSDLVRRALAVTLRNSTNLPHHLAKVLIADIDSIAVPILTSSPVLTDADLVDVLKSPAAAKVRAIAQRQTLSLHITQAIVSFGDSAAIANVAANDGALISEDTAELIATIHADDDLIREAALARHDMPPAVVTKLINRSADKVEANLKTYPGMSDTRARDVAQATGERARATFIGEDWPAARLYDYAKSLDRSGKLTPRLILRAAGRGDMRFGVAALSVLGGQSVEKTRLMVLAGGEIGVKAAAVRARFKGYEIACLVKTVEIYNSLEGRVRTAAVFQRRVVERLLSSELDLPEDIELELLDVLDGYARPRQVA